MPSPVDICNLALAELPDRSIASLEENSLQARECNRVYPVALAEAMERHAWSFARRRISVAQAVNDRMAEWVYAYAVPDDFAALRRVIFSAPTIPAVNSYMTYGQTAAPTGANIWDRSPPQPYQLAGRVLYTDVPDAVLEYTTADPSAWSALFTKALYFDIASRICTPLNKKADKKRELIGQAELWFARASAADLNLQQNTNDPMPEVFGVMG